MEKKEILKLLTRIRKKQISARDAFEKLRHLPYEDLGFAKVDHHRPLRTGFPEVIYCEGKTEDQVAGIFLALRKKNRKVLLTRARRKVFTRIKKLDPAAVFHPVPRLITLEGKKPERLGKVAVISAGTADIPVAEEAAVTAEISGSRVVRLYDVGVAGLHRLLDGFKKVADSRAIVVVAGMDGVLPSVAGGLAACPVIAVPTSVGYGANLRGIAPLLTMLNSCASNVSVVNINNGFGAGYIASMINRTPSWKT